MRRKQRRAMRRRRSKYIKTNYKIGKILKK